MKKITKEMCGVYVKDSYKSKFIFLVAVCIFVIIVLWFFTKNAIVVAISIALAIIAITLVFVAASKKIKNINPEDFYLVEDAVVDFQKKFSSNRGGGSGQDYIFTFRDHGKYIIHKSNHPTTEISLHKEKDIGHLSVEKLCIESGECGELFYLLIAKKKDITKIIKCFPQQHFGILEDDFDCIAGKYCCKK